MSVRAVTPRVIAISGHLQFSHGISCAGDCCNYDAFTDSLTTGEDIYDPEWPDKPLRLNRHRASSARPATDELSADPMNAPAPNRVGRDGRAAGATSSTRESQRRPLIESTPIDMAGERNGADAPAFTSPSALNPQAETGPVGAGSGPSAAGAAASPTSFPESGTARLAAGAPDMTDEQSRPGGRPGGS